MLHRYQESLQALLPLIPSRGPSELAPDRRAAPGDAGTAGSKQAHPAQALPAQAWLVRGLDYLELSRPGDLNRLSLATVSLRQALKRNPESGTARMALGDALARSGHLEEAADEYREQTRRTPDLGDAWYKLGLVYTDLAGKLTSDFARQQPGNALAIELSAEQLSRSGDYWGAAEALFNAVHSSEAASERATEGLADERPSQRAAQENGTQKRASSGRSDFHPGLHATFGIALLQLGYSHAAEREFDTELSHDPESLPAQFGMAEIDSLRSNWPGAIATIRHLMAAYPKEFAHQLESPPAPALSKASKTSTLPPGLAESPAGKLWAAWLGSAGLESPPHLDSASNSGPDLHPGLGEAQCSGPPSSGPREPGYWVTEVCAPQLLEDLRSRKVPTENERAKLVEIQYQLGDYQTARTSALALVERAGNNPWGHYWLAKSYAALSGECLGKLAEVSPDSARVHEILARYHSEHQQLAAARTEYEAALRLEPGLPDLHVGLGTVYWQSGDWIAAEAELKKALDLSPGSAVAAYELGDSYIQQRQWRQATAYLERALTDPAVERRAMLDLAKAQNELGNRSAAIRELTLLAKDDRDGEIHYRLALAYRDAGDTAKSEAALAASKALRKTSDQLSIERLENLQNEGGGIRDPGDQHK